MRMKEEIGERYHHCWFLELLGRHFVQAQLDALLAGVYYETVNLGLHIGLQTQQAANLSGLSMDDPASHKVGRIEICLFKDCGTKRNNLGFGDLRVHRVVGLEDVLYLWLGAAQLLPMLKEILRGHFWKNLSVNGSLMDIFCNLNWMLRKDASVKSERHSMFILCRTCAPPSTVEFRGLVCRLRLT